MFSGGMMQKLRLPSEVQALLRARNLLRDHMNESIASMGSPVALKFTFDGNLVGDIGEAIAVINFGIKLVSTPSNPGIDGVAADGRSVQVKATGTKRGAAFRQTEIKADHLLVFDLDFQSATAEVIFNGPEKIIRELLSPPFEGQKSVSRSRLIKANEKIAVCERLPLI